MRRVLLSACFASFLASGVIAAVIQVPADQPTIQAGIDAAVNGDTVLVSDGTYTGVGNRNITFNGKAIVVRSVNGAASTIVDVDSTLNRGFIFSSGEDTMSVLDGFTVTWAIADSGACVFISGSSPRILNCIFENSEGANPNQVPLFGIGVAVLDNSHPIFSNCIFSKIANWSAYTVKGGGLAVDASASVRAQNCTFQDVYWPLTEEGLGAALFDGGTGSKYIRCRFLRCGTETMHGGKYSTPVFLINSNSAFDSCLFADNELDSDGFLSELGAGGIFLKNSPATISNCTFFRAQLSPLAWPDIDSLRGATAILCQQSAATISNCIIAFNHWPGASYQGWHMSPITYDPADNLKPTITCTNIYGNMGLGGDWVGPIASQLGINGNIRRNPYFCDTTNYDFHLAPNSPCVADSTGCGLMGAYARNPSCPPGNCCIGRTGNIDCDPDDKVDISDLSAIIDCLYIFPGSCNQHCCPGEENTDGDISGGVDISDLSALIDYLYISFTPTAMCLN